MNQGDWEFCQLIRESFNQWSIIQWSIIQTDRLLYKITASMELSSNAPRVVQTPTNKVSSSGSPSSCHTTNHQADLRSQAWQLGAETLVGCQWKVIKVTDYSINHQSTQRTLVLSACLIDNPSGDFLFDEGKGLNFYNIHDHGFFQKKVMWYHSGSQGGNRANITSVIL